MLRRNPEAPPIPAALTRRLARLRTELADEQVPIALDGPGDDPLLRELLYAREAPAHEGRPTRYGAVLLADGDSALGGAARRRLDDLAVVVPLDGYDLAAARRFADGRSSFLVRDTQGRAALACFPHSVEYEAALVELQRAVEAVVVQRRADGSVRVCTPDGVIVWAGYQWRVTPDSTRFARHILRLVPQADRDVLVALLDLCIHWLSAGRVGGTLVWYVVPAPAAEGRRELAGLGVGRAIPAPPLSVTERAHRPALLSALAQLDRAAVVEATGTVTHLNVALVPSSRSITTVPAVRGTRHTSARRFTFDEPRAVVAVVSQDGGVTVYSDGAAIGLVQMAPTRSSSDDIGIEGGDEDVARCGRCHQTVVVETVERSDHGGAALCPVCGDPITAGEGWRVVGVRKVIPRP